MTEPQAPAIAPATRPSIQRSLALVMLGMILGGTAVALFWPERQSAPPTAAAPDERHLYQCPMHPSVTSDHPSDCPICGMKLVEVKTAPKADTPAPEATIPGLSAVTIDPTQLQLIGVATTKITRGPLSTSLRTVARVERDPTRVRTVNVKFEGYIEKIFVDFEGKPVRRGDPLFSIYSPSLLVAQSELLLAQKTEAALAAGGSVLGNDTGLLAAARKRLALWDVPDAEVERVLKTGEPSRTLTILSPLSGVVTAKNLVQGARVNPGDTPFEITDLSVVWVFADAYETDLAKLKLGMPATFTSQAYPGVPFAGTVDFIEPLFDGKTRTAKFHVHVKNSRGLLKPAMFGEVVIDSRTEEGLRVPADAVVRTGTKDVVFVALGDGKFEPREVTLGAQAGEYLAVQSGLQEGDQVVVRANFLLDSESRLRFALTNVGKGP